MKILSIIAGLLTETAYAVTLEGAGAGGTGIDAMWKKICSTLSFCSLGPSGAVSFFTGRVTAMIFSLIGGIALIIVVYAGIRLTLSQGEQDALTKTKQIVTWALVGLALSLVASAAVGFVSFMLNNWLA